MVLQNHIFANKLFFLKRFFMIFEGVLGWSLGVLGLSQGLLGLSLGSWAYPWSFT